MSRIVLAVSAVVSLTVVSYAGYGSQGTKTSNVTVVNTDANPVPVDLQNTDVPVTVQNTQIPVTVQNTEVPVNVQNTQIPVTVQNTEIPVTVQNTEIPVTINGTPEVQVKNGASPLSVKLVDAREPHRFSQVAGFADGNLYVSFNFNVPPGKKFHATHVSSYATVPDPGTILSVRLVERVGVFPNTALDALPYADQGAFGSMRFFQASEPVDFVIQPGSDIEVTGIRSSGSGTGSFSLTISGYYVNVP